jgi:hypothetical protein
MTGYLVGLSIILSCILLMYTAVSLNESALDALAAAAGWSGPYGNSHQPG